MTGRLNPERVALMVGEVRESLSVLRALQADPPDRILADPVRLGAVKFYLLQAIQAVIDLCQHVVAKKCARAPADYADCFRLMAEAGLLTGDELETFSQMARFRNLLVHLYWMTDDQKVVSFLKERLGDFEGFMAVVDRVMKEEKS